MARVSPEMPTSLSAWLSCYWSWNLLSFPQLGIVVHVYVLPPPMIAMSKSFLGAMILKARMLLPEE